MPASIFSETELARLASFPEEIPGDDLIRAIHADGCRPRPRRHPARGSKPLKARASALCTSLPRLRSAQFERSSAIGRLLCRGPARGQPGRDSILRSTRADALHSTSPRFGNTSASRCSGHGTWKNSKLGLSNEPLSTMLRRFSFASLVSGCAPRGSSFQHPAESYDLPVRRTVAHRRERTPWSTLKWLGQGASGESPGSIKSDSGSGWRKTAMECWGASGLGGSSVANCERSVGRSGDARKCLGAFGRSWSIDNAGSGFRWGKRIRKRCGRSKARREESIAAAWKGQRNGRVRRRGGTDSQCITVSVAKTGTGSSARRRRSGWSRCGRSTESRLTRR